MSSHNVNWVGNGVNEGLIQHIEVRGLGIGGELTSTTISLLSCFCYARSRVMYLSSSLLEMNPWDSAMSEEESETRSTACAGARAELSDGDHISTPER